MRITSFQCLEQTSTMRQKGQSSHLNTVVKGKIQSEGDRKPQINEQMKALHATSQVEQQQWQQ